PATLTRSAMAAWASTTMAGSMAAHPRRKPSANVQPAPPVRRSPAASGRSESQKPSPSGPQSSASAAAKSGLRARRVRASSRTQIARTMLKAREAARRARSMVSTSIPRAPKGTAASCRYGACVLRPLLALLVAVAAFPGLAAGQTLVDDRAITLTSAAAIAARRQVLIDYIWGADGFPTGLPSHVEIDDLSPVQ